MHGERLIHMRGLSKVFTEGRSLRTALRDINLTIARGEYVAIAGPSGGGKSTLLSIMGLLEPQTTGRFMLAGQEVSEMGLTARARLRNQQIGFIFQSFNLIGDLSVAKNIELPLTYRPGMSSGQRKVRVDQCLNGLNSARGKMTCRQNSQAASNNGWRSHGRSPAPLPLSWRMSQRGIWTARMLKKSWAFSKSFMQKGLRYVLLHTTSGLLFMQGGS